MGGDFWLWLDSHLATRRHSSSSSCPRLIFEYISSRRRIGDWRREWKGGTLGVVDDGWDWPRDRDGSIFGAGRRRTFSPSTTFYSSPFQSLNSGLELIITVIIDAGFWTAGPIDFHVGSMFHRRAKYPPPPRSCRACNVRVYTLRYGWLGRRWVVVSCCLAWIPGCGSLSFDSLRKGVKVVVFHRSIRGSEEKPTRKWNSIQFPLFIFILFFLLFSFTNWIDN